MFSPYLLKEEGGSQPASFQRAVSFKPTVLALLPPKKSRNVTFPEALPISSITSSARLGAIIGTASATLKDQSQDRHPPRQPWNIPHDDSDNPFNGEDSSEEIVSTI